MSEYMEKHSISKLIGSPPGYVGYDEGGRLTESVRRRPYSVVLFDEIEKAHPDIFNILLQILDNGRLTDSQGRTSDFRNTILILTSNIGFSAAEKANRLGFGNSQTTARDDEEERQVMRAVSGVFRPEFLNRLDEIIVFKPLTNDDIKHITLLTLREVADRAKSLGINLDFSDPAIDLVSKKGYSRENGARNLRRTVVVMVEDKLSSMILEGKIKPGDSVTVTAGEEAGIVVLVNQKQA